MKLLAGAWRLKKRLGYDYHAGSPDVLIAAALYDNPSRWQIVYESITTLYLRAHLRFDTGLYPRRAGRAFSARTNNAFSSRSQTGRP